ncbi:MAG: coenzyme F420-0:L-glutamate ligase [Bacillota bacterium]|nr:coenzyme F420-0:L-glutamate ligase [Bacillota bacterium]
MKIQAIKTRIVEVSSYKLTKLLNESLLQIRENSIIAVTSKVVSLCEGNAIPFDSANKDELIENNADFFLPKSGNKYDVYLTIKNDLLVPSAGIDESNTNGFYVMWPKDPQCSVNSLWEFLRNKHNIKNLGIIITDSAPSPLKWGVTGKCIAYCGFKGINSKVGEEDLFGRKLNMTQINVADALAAAAVLCMGESNEQTPVALIEDVSFVQFENNPPSKEELENLHIDIKDDLFGQLLEDVKWHSNKE